MDFSLWLTPCNPLGCFLAKKLKNDSSSVDFLLVSLTQYNKVLVILIFCYIDKSCHTERSEVFINSKRALNFFGFFAFLQKAQNDNDLRVFCFVVKAQNDKVLNDKCLKFFVAAMPCNSLVRFVRTPCLK